MGGFLPLLEGFLAFALTMLALTTAVASVVGVLQNLLRVRAAMLRDLVGYFYRAEVAPLVQEGDSRDGGSSSSRRVLRLDESPDETRWRFVADMTALPTLDPASPVAGRPEGGGAAPAGGGAEDPVVEALVRGESLGPWRLVSRWRSLSKSLDALPVDEFAVRLRRSRLGHELAGALGPEASERTCASLVEAYAPLNAAASERLLRFGRAATIVTGFVLAFAVNIDSIHLLDTFLTSPQLRGQVLARADEVLDAAKAPAVTGEAAPGPNRAPAASDVRASLTGLSASARAADELLDELPPGSVRDEMAALLSEVRRSADAAREAVADSEDSLRDIQRIVLGVTASLPVGWDLYPNCDALATDVRCVRTRLALARTGASQADGLAVGLGAAWRHDRAGFIRWWIGVALTAVLLGLGSSFWSHVVIGFLRARNLLGEGQRQARTGDDERRIAAATAGSGTAAPAGGKGAPAEDSRPA
jgi:hypothetical protein